MNIVTNGTNLLPARALCFILEMTMPRKKSKKVDRVATTNIKVTVDTHRELQVATEMLGKTQSEVISMALRALLPNLIDEIRRRDEIKRMAVERAATLSEN